jgi:hypothetical protein
MYYNQNVNIAGSSVNWNYVVKSNKDAILGKIPDW